MKVKNLVLGIGIVIVFMFLLHNGIRAFYKPSPQYEDFCKNNYIGPVSAKALPEGQTCQYSAGLREAEQSCYNGKGQPVYEYDEYGCNIRVRECDYCQKDFNSAKQEYNKIVFVIALIIGIVVLLIGYAKLSIEPVGSALMASGIGAIIYGTIINWQNLGNMWRFLLLLIAFILLIWIALKLNTNEKKSFWRKLGMKK